MKTIPYDVGRVVLSKQGHDKGRWLVVVGILDEKHVLIADGQTRRLEKPKKKQWKHLRAKPVRLETIAALLQEGKSVLDKPVLDSEIRKALKAFAEEEARKYMAPARRELWYGADEEEIEAEAEQSPADQ